MSFNLESSKNNEINDISEVKVDSEQLSETEETAENFDDCSLYEVQDSKGNEVNAKSLKDAEEDYDDCEANMEETEEKNPELADEDDDFSDCGKETDGQYAAEVIYTTDREISQEEVSAELQEAYNECDDPEDMQQLKENANENEHIEVHNAEVVERPENSEPGKEATKEEYEEAQEELEEAQENLESQQEVAQEYQEDLENQINKHEDNVSEETESINNEVSEETGDSMEVEETDGDITASEGEKIEADDLEEMDDVSKVEASEVNEDALSEDVSENVEENTNTELSNEAKEQIFDEVAESANEELSDKDVEVMVEEKSEAFEETVEEKTEEQESVDAVEETADELDEEKTEQLSEQTEQSLQERIDDAFEKEAVTESEINNLRDEHADELQAKLEEKNSTEAELKSKFDEVLSKQKGSDEYRQSLQEYNALQDKKSELADQIATMEKQQDLLDKKIIELGKRESVYAPSNDGTDWSRTSNTPEQESILKEMEDNREIEIPKVEYDITEPKQGSLHLPTSNSGDIVGEREEGNFEFIPKSSTVVNHIKTYGRNSVEYKDGYPDFSPFTLHKTPWGNVNCNIEIPHMTAQRRNPSLEYGAKRPRGTSHQPGNELGNFAQADNEIVKILQNDYPELSADDFKKYREANKLTWHECPDGKTMQLVPTDIHNACRHNGGVAEMKYRMAWGDITRLTQGEE